MKDFKRKQQFRRRLYSKPVILLLIILLFFILKGVWSVRQKAVFSQEKHEQAEMIHAELMEKEEQAREQLEYIQSPLGHEEELRRKFNVSKEGEQVIVIVEPDEPEEEIEVPQETSFWQKLQFWR